LILLPLTSPGCIAFYTYHPTLVTVRDVETGATIPHARVTVSYPHMLLLNAPSADVVETGLEGEANIRTATLFHIWKVSADGYFDADSFDGLTKAIRQTSPDQVDVGLYRQPTPSITFIVPKGYRGPLKMETTQLTDHLREAAGKRAFAFNASSHGYVRVEVTPFVLSIEVLMARYEDGQIIPTQADRFDRETIALRRVCSVDARDLYVVGTEMEKQAVASQIFGDDPNHPVLNEKAFAAFFEER
jgi:hypothetical protein